MGEDDKRRVEEYRKVIEADDAEDAAKGKLFDPKELLREAREVRQKHIKNVGLVNYTVLSLDQSLEISRIADGDDRIKQMLFTMLHKSYPDLRKEDIGSWPNGKAARILNELSAIGVFLQDTKTSPTGSASTRKPKK